MARNGRRGPRRPLTRRPGPSRTHTQAWWPGAGCQTFATDACRRSSPRLVHSNPRTKGVRLPGSHWVRSFVPPEARSGPEAERVRHPNPSWSSGDLRRACRLQHAVQEPDHGCGCGACEKRDFKNGAELMSSSQWAKRTAQTAPASARTLSDTYKNLDAGCGVSDIHKFTPQTLCHERVALTAARKRHKCAIETTK